MASNEQNQDRDRLMATPPVTWPQSSRYYNPVTMRSSVIKDLNDDLIYKPHLLYCVQLAGDTLGKFHPSVATEESRNEFVSAMERNAPDVTVFFLSFIFSHRHTPDGKSGDMRFSISLTAETWLWLLDKMEIHPRFVECLYLLLGHYSTFVTYDDDSSTPQAFHLLVKIPPAGHLEAAFYLKYDFRTKKSLVIVAGNDLDAHVKNLSEHLKEIKSSEHPFGMVLNIVSRYFYFLEYQKRQLAHSVIMMERVTGRGAVTYSDGEPRETDPEAFDLENMHWIGANQRNVTYGLAFQQRLATYLQAAHRQFVSIKLGKTVNFEQMPRYDKYTQEALAAHKCNVAGVLEDSRVIGARAQAQLNVADTIINTMIAKQSQRTADESKSIAFETRRDSTSMKTIASLTMVYLPSTFAATIFSTSFFTFDDGNGAGLSVRTDIWKFIIVAVVLTLLTIVAWVWLNKYGVPAFLKWTESSPNVDSSTSNRGPRKRKLMTFTPMPNTDKTATATVGDAQVDEDV